MAGGDKITIERNRFPSWIRSRERLPSKHAFVTMFPQRCQFRGQNSPPLWVVA